MVPFAEIEENEFNLNLPRYIDSQAPEDPQDITGHLQGGIPAAGPWRDASRWAVVGVTGVCSKGGPRRRARC